MRFRFRHLAGRGMSPGSYAMTLDGGAEGCQGQRKYLGANPESLANTRKARDWLKRTAAVSKTSRRKLLPIDRKWKFQRAVLHWACCGRVKPESPPTARHIELVRPSNLPPYLPWPIGVNSLQLNDFEGQVVFLLTTSPVYRGQHLERPKQN